MNWFETIIKSLVEHPTYNIRSNGEEILLKTEDGANAIADLLESLYAANGEEVIAITGYYNPEEDEKNNQIDNNTGWWYVTIE